MPSREDRSCASKTQLCQVVKELTEFKFDDLDFFKVHVGSSDVNGKGENPEKHA